MMRIGVVISTVLALATAAPLWAQSSNDSLFRTCAGYYNAMRSYARDWDHFQTVDKPEMNRRYSYLESVHDAELAEVKRLQQIAEIMQSSDEVWDKYYRAFDRYEQAASDLDNFADDANRVVNAMNSAQEQRELLGRRVTSECPNSWNGEFIRGRCNSGNSDYDAICLVYGL